MTRVTKLQPGTPIFGFILEAAMIDLESTLAAVSVDAMQEAAQAQLVGIVGKEVAPGLARQFSIEDVRRELFSAHGILTIPVFKAFFTKRNRVRALQGYVDTIVQTDGSHRTVTVPPNPIAQLPIGRGRIKSGLVRADKYPDLLAVWTQRDRVWANGSWHAYDHRLGETYDAGLLDRSTLQILVADSSASPVPKMSNLARIINDVKRLGIKAVAAPTP